MSYETPASNVTAQLVIKKSEFITYAYPVNSRQQAMFHVEQLRLQYPDARHHCSAYIIGDPKNTSSAGYDDDGEPSGTAGRPMLNVLQHKSIGNVIVIVVRYFGGIKLGAGGLTRAYSGATQAVVDNMELVPFIAMTQIKIKTDYANEAQIRYLVDQVKGSIDDVSYEHAVIVKVTMAEKSVSELADRLGMSGQLVEM